MPFLLIRLLLFQCTHKQAHPADDATVTPEWVSLWIEAFAFVIIKPVYKYSGRYII